MRISDGSSDVCSSELRRLVARELRAAFQIGDREPDAGEPGGHGVDVTRLAAVAGAGQRQLRLAQLESVGAAALDEGDGLQRLDGGAGIDRAVGIAGGEDRKSTRLNSSP